MGKFSQSDLRPSIKYIYSHDDYLNLKHNSPHLKVKSITPLTDHVAEVACEMNDEVSGFHKNTHTIIYSYVTAYARIRMMKDMRRLMKLGLIFNI